MHDLMVQCPFCLELVELEVPFDEVGTFVQDCDVCCRPWHVRIERDADGEPAVTVGRA